MITLATRRRRARSRAALVAPRFLKDVRRAGRRASARVAALADRRRAGPVRHARIAHRSAISSIRGSPSAPTAPSPPTPANASSGRECCTAQTQLVAEELSVPLDRVRADSVRHRRRARIRARRRAASRRPTNFNERNLAQAGATAREALLRLAATRLGVPRRSARGCRRRHRGEERRVQAGDLRRAGRAGRSSTSRSMRRPSGSRRASGRCSARPVRASTWRRWRPAGSSSCTTCACRACCTARVVRPPAVGATLVERRRELDPRSLPGVVKVVVKKNFVGVVAEKPWQAMQAAAQLKATWTRWRRRCPPQRDFYDYLRTQPSRDAFVVNSQRRRRSSCAAAAAIAEGHLPASVSDARVDGHVVRGRRRAGRQGDGLVADAVGVSDAKRRGHAAWPASRQRPRDLHARVRLLRDQRRRHRVVRRGVAVAGGRANRCACSSRARTRWPGRTTASPTRSISASALDADGNDRRLGLRGVVRRRSAAGPATTRPATSSPACSPGFEPAPFTPRRPRERRRASSATAATPRRRMCRARRRQRCGGAGTITSERVLTHTRRARRSSPDRCGRRRGCRTRSRMSASSTRSPRT